MTLFTAAIEKVRQERAEIVSLRDELMSKSERLSVDIEVANGKLYALDFALKAMETEQPAAPVEQQPPARAPRLDVTAAVLSAIQGAGDSGISLDDIRAIVKRDRGPINNAIFRLHNAGKITGNSATGVYRAAEEAAQAAAE